METRRGFVVIFNPKAGRGRAYETLRLVTSRLDGRLAPVMETSLDGSFAPSLRERIRDVRSASGSAPVAVAVGGDGTVSMIVEAMRDLGDAIVAIVPAGAGNDLGAALGIADVAVALDALESGATRLIDVGTVSGRRFVNCVGMGLDAEVGALAARMRRRGYPPKPSYYAAALVGLFFVRPVGTTIDADGARRRFEDGVMVTVGNGPFYGGGFRGAPGAALDDGLLDVYAFSDINGFVARLALMKRIRAGTHPADANVTALRAGSFVIEFDREVAMHVDGETASVKRADFSVQGRALQVVTAAVTASPAALAL
jgi:diacylglycerol kinase (ATP)